MVRQVRDTSDTSVNGVNVDRLKSTIDAVKAAPTLAKFTFRATNRWITGGLNRTTIREFHGAGAENHRDGFVIDNAQPSLMLGGDEAPNPVEYVLHAFVGCLTTTLVYHAAMDGVRIQAVESQVEGQIDLHGFLGLREDLPGGFQQVTVNLRVKADCSDEKLAELTRIARRRSPISNFVLRAVPISVICQPM